MADVRPWWEVFPSRAEHEYACLDAAGIAYDLDEEAAARSVLQLRIRRIADEPVDLVATFPDLYPFFRPAVAWGGDRARFSHHLQPFSGDLCLLGRRTAAWSPEDTLAWLLSEQLPKTVRLGTLHQAPADEIERKQLLAEEVPQAEPFSEYLTAYEDNAMILVDSAWELPDPARGGRMDVAFASLHPEEGKGLLGAITALQDQDGVAFGSLASSVTARFPHAVTARWVRVDQPPRADDAETIWQDACAADPASREPPWQPLPAGLPQGFHVQLLGVSFPEERAHRSFGHGWLFLVRVRWPAPPSSPPPRNRRGKAARPAAKSTVTRLARAGYAGVSDLTGRIPELTGLGTRQVVVFGLGAVGSTVSEQLARAGVGRLRLVDYDRLEPGNLVRHAAGLREVGQSKALAAASVTGYAGLHADVLGSISGVGGVRREPGQDQLEQQSLVELIEEADLVVDCTAEKGVQRALAWLCARHSTPLVVASATNGGWGGRVARFEPSPDAGCWFCLELALTDGSVPLAPAAPDADVQPPGCADPTFTGTGFDIAEVALHAVRVVVGALQASADDGYPRTDDAVHVLALRGANGEALLPTWTGYPLAVHPDCPGPHQRA